MINATKLTSSYTTFGFIGNSATGTANAQIHMNNNAKISGKTISFYSTSGSAFQANTNGITYYWFAITI